MKFQSTLVLWILLLMTLMSCQQQENLISVQQDDAYIFGTWYTPSKESVNQARTEILNNIKLHNQTARNSLTLITDVAPETLLPQNGEINDWVRSRRPTTYNPKTLYVDRFIPSEDQITIYKEFGFRSQAEMEYQSPKYESLPFILLEIFDMGTPENAFGIFSVNNYPNPKFEWIGCKAIISGKYLWFWKGKYFIQIEGYGIATGIRNGMIELAKVTAKKIQDKPQKIPLLELLPNKYIRGSERLWSTDWLLQQINKSLPEIVPQLDDGAIGVFAKYLPKKSKNNRKHYYVFVIKYPDIAAAEKAYTLYRNTLVQEMVDFENDPNSDSVLIEQPVDY